MIAVNRRILICDDNKDIHDDFRKILGGKRTPTRSRVEEMEKQIFADVEGEAEEEDSGSEVVYEIDSAFQGLDAIDMVAAAYEEKRPYSLIFMDVRMPPGIDGIETISRIWEHFPNVEIIICTAYSDYSFEEILSQLEKTDRLLFLNKPFDSIAVKQMALSLSRKWSLHNEAQKHVSRLKEEIFQRRQSEERLNHLIHHDGLTGLPNRSQLQNSLEGAIKNARECHTRFALFFIDLDRFKEINDTLGYQNGDDLIKQIAARLRKEFEGIGDIYRHGGDEFALLLHEIISVNHTVRVAQQIQRNFEPPFEVGDINVEVRCGISIVIYPDHGCNTDMLMRYADMTLAGAKQTDLGYGFYAPHLNFHSPQRLMLLSDLRQAISSNNLMLYYQPKVDVESGMIVGVESLIRWAHQEHGFIPPREFIPLANRCGYIKNITKWVLREVARQWCEWRDKEGLDLTISINLSTQDLLDQNLYELLIHLFESGQMPPDRLVLEVTETGVMEDPKQSANQLASISKRGVKVAIDNFGTGYSSLSYIKNLPVDEIKIDESFVEEMGKNLNDVVIVQSMIDLGHNLGLKVVAEGVGTGTVYSMLQEFGCDLIQGSIINPPVPAGELVLWLRNSEWEVAKLEHPAPESLVEEEVT